MKSTVEYSGGVTAKLSVHNSNGQHFKNSGQKLLWELLARAVTDNEILSITPKSIGIYERVGENSSSDRLLTYTPIPIYGKVYGDVVSTDENSCSALFSATATSADKKSDATGQVVLKLLTADDRVLAEVVDNNAGVLKGIHNAMIPGIDAMYEWQLTFRNATAVSQNPPTPEQSEDNT